MHDYLEEGEVVIAVGPGAATEGLEEAQAKIAAELPALVTAGTIDVGITTGHGQHLGARKHATRLERLLPGGLNLDEEESTKRRARASGHLARTSLDHPGDTGLLLHHIRRSSVPPAIPTTSSDILTADMPSIEVDGTTTTSSRTVQT